MDITIILIIALTCITSFLGFNNADFFDKGKFNVAALLKDHQWYRLISSAFLHGDFVHLLFNMFTLYFFSGIIIEYLSSSHYLVIYFSAVLGGNLLSLFIYRRNSYYSAIGASGGVSGILFAAIAINPFTKLIIFPIPIPMEGWIFGIFYLAYSVYGMKSQLGNIGHAAHLGGAVVGLLFAIIFMPQVLQTNGLYIGIMAIPLIVLAYYVYQKSK